MKSNPAFQHGLDNSIGRLAKQLPTGDLKMQAASLGGEAGDDAVGRVAVAGDLDEDDLT